MTSVFKSVICLVLKSTALCHIFNKTMPDVNGRSCVSISKEKNCYNLIFFFVIHHSEVSDIEQLNYHLYIRTYHLRINCII